MSTGADARIWGGSTLDERSAERRKQLVDAAFEVLGTAGATAVTVRAVTKLAGLSPRYFYESFESREDLLVAAFDDGFDRIKSAVEAAMEEASDGVPDRARASLDATARCLEDDPRLARALMRETLAEPALRARAEQALPEFVLTIAISAFGADVAADPARFQVAVLAISGMQVALLMAWAEGKVALTRDELVDRLLEIITAVASTLG
jgi:AcrR family transcriptional regulator